MTSERKPQVVEKLNRLSESRCAAIRHRRDPELPPLAPLAGQGGAGSELCRHFAFLDYLFGTAVTAEQKWPERYGVLGDYVPNGFVKQQAFPFTWKSDPPPPPV